MAADDERTRGEPDPAPSAPTKGGYREEHPKGRREAVVGTEPMDRDAVVPDRPPDPRQPKDAPA